MVINNIDKDVKIKCLEEDLTQAQLADKIGTTASYVNRIINKPDGVVNRTFVHMPEGLGYDIRLVYEKREEAHCAARRQCTR